MLNKLKNFQPLGLDTSTPFRNSGSALRHLLHLLLGLEALVLLYKDSKNRLYLQCDLLTLIYLTLGRVEPTLQIEYLESR